MFFTVGFCQGRWGWQGYTVKDLLQVTDHRESGASADGNDQTRAVGLAPDDGIDLHAKRQGAPGELNGSLINGRAVGDSAIGCALGAGTFLGFSVISAKAHARVALAVIPTQGLSESVEGRPDGQPWDGAKGLRLVAQPSQRLRQRVLFGKAGFEGLEGRIVSMPVARVTRTGTTLLRSAQMTDNSSGWRWV